MINNKVLAIIGGVALFGAEIISVSAASAELRVRCERRGNKRSRVSVDANDLIPGDYKIMLKSGGKTARTVTQTVSAGLDEFEADYDSNRADIRAGATKISATFIINGAVNVAVQGPVSFAAQDYSCVVR